MPVAKCCLLSVLVLMSATAQVLGQVPPDIQRTEKDEAAARRAQQQADRNQGLLVFPQPVVPAEIQIAPAAIRAIRLIPARRGNPAVSLAIGRMRGKTHLSARIGARQANPERLLKQLQDSMTKDAESLLAKIESECDLKEAQLDKLRLAARGDIMRIRRRVQDWLNQQSQDLENANDVRTAIAEISELNDSLASCFDSEDSLFARVRDRALSENEQDKLGEVLRRHGNELTYFCEAIRRTAVLTDQTHSELQHLLEEEWKDGATLTIETCSELFLQTEPSLLSEVLNEREIAAARRLSNYYLTRAKAE